MTDSFRSRPLSLLAAVLLCGALSGPAEAQFQPPRPGKEQLTNIFLPAPRGLRQQLGRAEKSLQEERFGDAVDLLGQLLASPATAAGIRDGGIEQDYFLAGSGRPGTQVSLKTQAQRLLGAMPAKGRELYELKFGVDARQLLDQALVDRDLPALVEVTRRYFHTRAGYEAAMLIGRHYLDQGRPLAGALCFQRLSESPTAVARYDPELSVLLATCWMLADMPQRAKQTLMSLGSRAPRATIRIGRGEVSLPERDDQVLAWLEKLIGTGFPVTAGKTTEWVMYRGNAARNAESAGGFPLLTSRWRVRTTNHPTEEELIRMQQQQYRDQGVPALPVLHPLAVQDVVLMRSPRRLLAVDFSTGKRIWEFPWFETPDEKALHGDRVRPRRTSTSQQALELNQRVWEDAAYGEMSSDGRQVFILWGLNYAGGNTSRSAIQPFGRLAPQAVNDANKLVALDMKAEGKLRWIVGGEDGTDEPALAGAFFLGVPLPLMGKLYAMAEFNGEIRLVVLDGDTGRLDWSQQLAHVDDLRSVTRDASRRLTGATPSFSDGVLICPTSAGAVVALDLATRSLLWGYQYPQAGIPTRLGFRSYPTASKQLGDRWTDATTTIADGCVLITPVESDNLYCLDLLTGKPRWKPRPRQGMLYVGCVAHGNAVLIGTRQLQAVALKDGSQTWTCDLPLGMPSGRGLLAEDTYYLPTSASHLLQFDVKTGKILHDNETEQVLGNLVAYREQIISLNVDWLSSYFQTAPLRKKVDRLLRESPNDIWALTRRAELLLYDDELNDAVATLQKAYRLAPDDDAVRTLLVRSLLKALRSDFAANQKYATELEGLLDQPARRAEYYRRMAVGYHELKQPEKAIAFYIKLASMATAHAWGNTAQRADLVRVDDRLKVRRDRWMRARLGQLWASADEDSRQRMGKTIQEHFEQVLETRSPSRLARFIEHFGDYPIGQRAQLELARLLIEQQELLEAELQLTDLQESAPPELAASATALLAGMLQNAGKLSDAAICYRQLSTTWSDTKTLDGKTGRQLVDLALKDGQLQQAWDEPPPWLRGKCNIEEGDRRASFPTYTRISPIHLTQVSGPFSPEHRFAYNRTMRAVLVRDPQGQTIQQILLGDRQQFNVNSGAPTNHAVVRGHLAVMAVGFEVIAVDTLVGKNGQGDVVLWRRDLSNSLVGSRASSQSLMPRSVSRSWGPPRYFPVDRSGKPIGQAGPITRYGVVYQKMQELTCADLLTGEPVWTRSGAEAGSDIFGDDDYVFVVPPAGEEAIVLRTADGTELGRRQVTSRANRWITRGRHVLSCEVSGDEFVMRWFDAWTQKDVWKRKLNARTRCWQVGQDEVAAIDPDGKFVVLQIASGDVQVEAQLQPEPRLSALYVLRSREDYTVVASEPSSSSSSSGIRIYGILGANQCPQINGHVYSIDRATGKQRWPRPASIRQFSLLLDQPTESPLVLFLQHRQMRRSPTSTNTTITASLLAIDKRDGRQLLEKTGIPLVQSYEVVARPDEQTVTVDTNSQSLTFTFTDEPAPPAEPVQMEAPSTAKSALQRAGKIAGAVLDALAKENKAKQAGQPAQKADPKPVTGQTAPAKPPQAPQPQQVPKPPGGGEKKAAEKSPTAASKVKETPPPPTGKPKKSP